MGEPHDPGRREADRLGVVSRSSNPIPWWRDDSSDVHVNLYDHAVQTIDRHGRRSTLRRLESVYTGQAGDNDWGSLYKVAANALLSVFAQLSRATPLTQVLTEGGSRPMQQRGRALTAWLLGQRVALKGDALRKQALFDAVSYGAGAIHTFRDEVGKPCQQLVWIGDLGVEPREERNRAVHTLYRAMRIDREVAMARWPSQRDALESADDQFREESVDDGVDNTDLVTVVEAWRHTVGKVTGRHAIVCSSCTLLNEAWDKTAFPIDVLHFNPRHRRFFGIGLLESMAAAQEQIDMVSNKIDTSFEKGAPKWMIPESAHVDDDAITDTPYEEIRFSGPLAPELITPPAISSDWRTMLDQTMDMVYSLHGISPLSASSQVPSRVEAGSGKALRVLTDVEAAFFFPQSSGYEEWSVDVDRSLIRVAEEIASDEGPESEKIAVLGIPKSRGRSPLKQIKLGDARFDDENMVLRALAKAKLSKSPAGQLADVSQMSDLGIVNTTDQMADLLEMPDTVRFMDVDASGREAVDMQIEAALDGTPQTPEPSFPLEYAEKQATLSLNLALLDEVDGADTETLRDYLLSVQDEIKKIREAAAPPPAAPPSPAGPALQAVPGDAGGAPPIS